MSGAAHNRHASKQDYRTPDDFRLAVERRLGMPAIDLACDEQNRFGASGVGVPIDSLSVDWTLLALLPTGASLLCWLNPPFNDIAPWAAKCAAHGNNGVQILFLVPASIGSNWFQEHVHHKAMVLALNPRMSFDGKNPYPKDLMLCVYGLGYSGFDVWRWKP